MLLSVAVAGVIVAIGPVSSTAAPATPDFAAIAAAEFEFTPTATALAPQESSDAATSQPNPLAIDDASIAALENQFFHRGSWRWQVTGGVASNFDDDTFVLAGFAASYFLADELTIDFELNALYFWQGEGDNTAGINLAMLFRWHFWRSDDPAHKWSLYADAGAGILFTGSDVPDDGESFNFTPQAGVGFSMLLDEAKDVRLLSGVRWYHISNANLFEDNPGLNRLMVYAGVNFPF